MIIQDGFGVCSGVPAILHFGDTVAVFILTKNVLLLFVRKIHEVTPNAIFGHHSILHFIHISLPACMQRRQVQVTCDQVWL